MQKQGWMKQQRRKYKIDFREERKRVNQKNTGDECSSRDEYLRGLDVKGSD